MMALGTVRPATTARRIKSPGKSTIPPTAAVVGGIQRPDPAQGYARNTFMMARIVDEERAL